MRAPIKMLTTKRSIFRPEYIKGTLWMSEVWKRSRVVNQVDRDRNCVEWAEGENVVTSHDGDMAVSLRDVLSAYDRSPITLNRDHRRPVAVGSAQNAANVVNVFRSEQSDRGEPAHSDYSDQ